MRAPPRRRLVPAEVRATPAGRAPELDEPLPGRGPGVEVDGVGQFLVLVVLLVGIPEGLEALLGDDLGAADVADAGGGAEVVGMGVGDDDRVHPLHRQTGLVHPLVELAPGA